MTNKPMLSVERELILLLYRAINGGSEQLTGSEHAKAFGELRALLDQPVKTSGYCSDYQNCECMDKTKSGREACENWVSWGKPSTCAESQVEPACNTPSGNTCPGDGVGACKKCPAAQQQGEPIYQVMYRGDGGGGWCDAEKDSYDMKVPHPKHWQTRIVYAEQPAPVAVVMPTPCKVKAGTRGYQAGWNACLESFARLNGVKP